MKNRFSLFDERSDGLPVVSGRRAFDKALGLSVEGVQKRQIERVVQIVFHQAERDCRSVRQRLRKGESIVPEGFFREHPVDEADPQAGLGVDPVCREQQFSRSRGSDKARQQPSDAVVAGEADPGVSRAHESRGGR